MCASRRASGERHGMASLTDDDVDMMRDLYEADRFKTKATRYWSLQRLAEKFEVSRRHVINIVTYAQRVRTVEDEADLARTQGPMLNERRDDEE